MKPLSISALPFFLLLIFSCSSAASSAASHDHFLQCLSHKFKNYSSISNDVYTPANSSYTSVLEFSIRNLRFITDSTPKPQVIITPEHEAEIPPIVQCAKKTGLETRVRSGGHDLEGLSYTSKFPFVIIDLINLRQITVDVEAKTAWIGAGATNGEVYYTLGQNSPVLGFTGGIAATVGVGGHYSGGGYGMLMRKYGLAGDNVIDARIVDVNGRIRDRKSMGEGLFWAIRGGGASSFGVVLAWKVQLVDVPETVTVFSIFRSTNVTELVTRWQYVAPQADRDLYLGFFMYRSNTTIETNFLALFLGGVDRLLAMLQETFPELGVTREECTEMSWVNATLFLGLGLPLEQLPALEVLLNRTQPNLTNLETKSDYVQTPISQAGFDGLVEMLYEPEAYMTRIWFVPYGGRMDDISESSTPFPHRAGNLYMIAGLVNWQNDEGSDVAQNAESIMSWSRRYYDYMAPYVSSSPRQAYLNYRDLEIGANNPNGRTTYAEASVWGKKYFKDNFDRLVRVKTVVDPTNFFKNEQSIPSLLSECIEIGDSDLCLRSSDRQQVLSASE